MILAATAGDAGAYYVQAVNERNGENKTSPPIHLSVASESQKPSEPSGSREFWGSCLATASRGALQ